MSLTYGPYQLTLRLEDYIQAILKEVHPNLKIQKDSYYVIEKILLRLLQKLILHSSIDFELTVTEVIGGDLGNHAISDYYKFLNGDYDLVYPIDTISSIIKNYLEDRSIYFEHFLKFLSIILEYITLEILSLAGNVANELKRIKIIPLFIFNGLFNDDELKNLIENIFDEPLEDVIFK